MAKRILLTLAGYDPSAGAGVLLDLKVFESLGFRGMAVLTSITAQNSRSVQEVRCLPPDFVWTQYQILAREFSFSGLKVGMICSSANLEIIQKILKANPNIVKVIDPIFIASAGPWLLEKEAVSAFLEKIEGQATLLTPNLEEASLLTGIKIKSQEDLKAASRKIFIDSHVPCLLKGGHRQGPKIDLLFDGQKFHSFQHPEIKKKVHGSGCFLSSAILAYLTQGKKLTVACSQAIDLTHQALKKAVKVGKGQHYINFPL